MARDYDYLLKILLVGDSDVGKHEILSGLDDASSERPFCGNSMNSSEFTFLDLTIPLPQRLCKGFPSRIEL